MAAQSNPTTNRRQSPPEQLARDAIDKKLGQAGWLIQDFRQVNLAAGLGVAVREHPTDSGPADYILNVDRRAVGVIEAKKDETILTVHEGQTLRYTTSKLKWRKDEVPLPFLFEATSKVIHFTDVRDPAPRSREVFHFFQPQTLKRWQEQPQTQRWLLAVNMPPLDVANLRTCQVEAIISGLEQSSALANPYGHRCR